MSALLGCIADDFTGATDLANMLVRSGMRTVQTIGLPSAPLAPDVDAIVVALKSRTIPATEAVRQSLAALDWLQAAGCRQFYFKYCSTFDSTAAGNIGPVSEALLEHLGADFAIACPAFPENGRTICRGYLFVGDLLLNESGMQQHPLTPMTDPNLVRVLQSQSRCKVGLVRYDAVRAGAEAIRARFAALKAEGVRLAIVDALNDADLYQIGEACAEHALITAGSGIALGLPENFRRQGVLAANPVAATLPIVDGLSAVLSGSCSRASNAQVRNWQASGRPAFQLDPLALARGEDAVAAALAWATPQLAARPVLIYATSEPEAVQEVQAKLGSERAGQLIEQALAQVAIGLVGKGVRKLVVAGGETSGAVVGALGVNALQIGPQIDPGVPWTATLVADPMLLALKSGNFGSQDFFAKALRQVASLGTQR
mgnify:CR=1 FL=1